MTKKSAKKMTILGFFGPTILILSGMVLFSANQFISDNLGTESGSVIARILNVIMFFLGVTGIVAIIPGLIFGMIGYSKSSRKDPAD